MMLFSSLDIPPDRDTYATLPGRYSLEARMLSSIPPVLPILKQPGLMPPTWRLEKNPNIYLKKTTQLKKNKHIKTNKNIVVTMLLVW